MNRPATDGWRGVLGREITFERIERLGAAAARRALAEQAAREDRGSGIAFVGYDTRFLGRELGHACARAVAGAGLPARLAEHPVPTPVVSWYTAQTAAALGLAVTASHNPAEYNGLKVREPDGASPADAALLAIEADADAHPAPAGTSADVDVVDPLPGYASAIGSLVDLELIGRQVPGVAVDPMHGAAGGLLARITAGSGTAVREVRGGRDPLFGGIAPEPKATTLGPLRAAMREYGCAFGFAHDGDGDRVLGLDAAGRLLEPGEMGLAIAYDLAVCRSTPGAIVGTIVSSRRLERFARSLGLPYHEVPVGFRNSSEVMRREPVLVAVEENGGVGVHGHLPERDGTFCALRFLEAVARTPLPRLRRELERLAGPEGARRRVDLPASGDARESIDRLAGRLPARIGEQAVREAVRGEGLKLLLADGTRIVLRAASTEPMLRISIEADDEAALEAAAKDIAARAAAL